MVETRLGPIFLFPRFLKYSDLALCPRCIPDSSENIILVILLLLSLISLSLVRASLFLALEAVKISFFIDLFTV